MRRRGQTITEYIIIVGVVVVALYAMGPAFKRGVQSMIKATADQLAAQKESDQDFTEATSHLDVSRTRSYINNQRNMAELNYEVTTNVTERAETYTDTITNMGFSPQ